MTAQCDPANLLILEADLIEHFQLPQCCITSLPGGVTTDGRRILSITSADYADFNKSKFMRLSSELFADLEDSQLEVLRDLCHAAHPSEEFFLTVATNQWLRTAIKSEGASVDLFSLTLTKEERQRNTSIHSNVLPYDPFWTRPPAIRDGTSKRVPFPCCILKEALHEGKTLVGKYGEWTQQSDRRQCDIGKHDQQSLSKQFWDIRRADVVLGKTLTSPYPAAMVSLVTWRGGTFIRKNPEQKDFDAEVDVMERLCHPHIVYNFGISIDGMQGSLYMECMQSDLLAVILDKNVRPEGGNMGPPFLHYDSVDILLQIAKAMAHMHENKVIHGDLKSQNILISKFKISENRYHYLAKVADFGGARVKDSEPFKATQGTTNYAAPEVLEFRDDKTKSISLPEKIDVYSFGLVAFEVLTGNIMKQVYWNKSPREVKKVVMEGTPKLPLRTTCQKDMFLDDKSLISLIESCWVDPKDRPSFSMIVEVLVSVRGRIQEPSSPSDVPPRQESAPEEAASGSNGPHPPSPVQANNTSDALHGQVPRPSRGQKHPGKLRRKLLHLFPCVSGGKVHN